MTPLNPQLPQPSIVPLLANESERIFQSGPTVSRKSSAACLDCPVACTVTTVANDTGRGASDGNSACPDSLATIMKDTVVDGPVSIPGSRFIMEIPDGTEVVVWRDSMIFAKADMEPYVLNGDR